MGERRHGKPVQRVAQIAAANNMDDPYLVLAACILERAFLDATTVVLTGRVYAAEPTVDDQREARHWLHHSGLAESLADGLGVDIGWLRDEVARRSGVTA